ncbi:MAG: MmgE/PrpD family protein, partial [Candidatus Pelagibacter sp.]|nr:MmgE/PrpD family protein [Candidatus Pelagibacter sp.]
MKGSNATEILSEFSANLTFEDIPKKVLEHIKLLFLDGVGCCIHGNTLPWTKTLMEVVL